jgi:hypothetical protein
MRSSSAAYHGGDLNGVCCCRLLLDGKKIYKEIKEYLLGYQHNNPDRCPDGEVMLTCDLHGQICGVLDSLSSILRMKYSKPQQEDYKKAETALKNLDYLWSTAKLAKTPKLHSLLDHALKQAKEKSRASKIKGHEKRAFSHAKMEAIMNSKDVQNNIKESQLKSKRPLRVDKKEEKAKRVKAERDEAHLNINKELQTQPYEKEVMSLYDELKEKYLQHAP